MKACSALDVNVALSEQFAAAAGSAVLVLRTDPEDGTVHCRVPSVGDLWFAASALTTEAPEEAEAEAEAAASGTGGLAAKVAYPEPMAPPPEPMGAAAEFEVLIMEVGVRAWPGLLAEELGRLSQGQLVWGTPHRANGHSWLQISASSLSELLAGGVVSTTAEQAEAWLLLQGMAGQQFVQEARMTQVRVHDGLRDQDLSFSVPLSSKMRRVKEELRRRPGYGGVLRLARRIAMSDFQECRDEDPVSQDLQLLDPSRGGGAEAELRRELLEVSKDPCLRCCTVRAMGPLGVHVHVAPSVGGSAELRVQCPPEYPFQNCTVDVVSARSPLDEDDCCGLLSKGSLVGKHDSAWKPSLTLRRLLLGVIKMMETWPGFLFSSLIEAVRVFLDRQLRVVYISVGCGGPHLAQQLPRAVQRLHQQRGGRCLVVLVDPLLTYPSKPRNVWKVSLDKPGKTVVCTCNATVEDWDLEGLENFISLVSNAGVQPDCTILADHRGASFMCAPCPINMHLAPEVQSKFTVVKHDEDVSLDTGAFAVLKAVHGISGNTQEERDVMEAIAKGGASLSFGRCHLTARQMGLIMRADRHGTHARTELPSELLLAA